MALSQLEKMKLIKSIKQSNYLIISYLEMKSCLSKNNANNPNIKLELIDFFSKYVLDCLKKEDASIKLITRMIHHINALIVTINEENRKAIIPGHDENTKIVIINEDSASILRNMRSSYNKHLVEFNKTSDSELLIALDNLEYLVGVDEKDLEEEKEELENRIKEQREELNSLKEQLNNYMKKVLFLEKEYKKKEELEEEVKVNNTTIIELKELIDELLIKSENLEELKKDNTEYEAIINLLTNNLERLKKEFDKLEKRTVEYEIENYLKEEIIIENKEIINRIIELLFKKRSTKLEIVDYLDDERVDENNILSYLIKAREDINIKTTSFGSNPIYEIIEPEVKKNQSLILDSNNSNTIDILLTSDYHMNRLNIKTINNIEKTYDYCQNNNIHLIINLGDLFGFYDTELSDYLKYQTGTKLVEQAIHLYPRRKDIYTAILGGNHDKDSLKYGYDALELFGKEREDIISLGYDHASLSIDGIESPLTTIMLHHATRKIQDPEKDETYNTQNYETYLNNYYQQINKQIDSYYTSLIGGSHISGIYEKFILIPSLMHDRKSNGATHLKIVLNDKKEIIKLILKPLVNDYRLEPITEVVYKKR